MPELSGTNNSGPFSPTTEGLPTGGLPPFANPKNLINLPLQSDLLRYRITFDLRLCLKNLSATLLAKSARVEVPFMSPFIPSFMSFCIIDFRLSKASNVLLLLYLSHVLLLQFL